MAERRQLDITLNARDRTRRGVSSASRRFSKFGDNVARISARMARNIAGIGLAVGAAVGVSAIRTFANFEKSMNRVKALTGTSGEEFEKLQAKARQLGSTTMFTASQAAEAMGFFALAGFKVNEILQAMLPTLDLAAAGQVEIAQSADIVAGIMRGMGIDASEVGEVVDILAKGMTSANTTIEMLGESMEKVGPIARTSGKKLSEVVAIIQILSDAKIQASDAGTALRNILIRLAGGGGEGGKVTKELEKLGASAFDAGGNFKHTADFLDELRIGLADYNPQQRIASIVTIAGVKASAAFAAILDAGSKKIRENEAALKSAAGTAKTIARVQLEGLAGAATELKSAWEELQISMVENWGPALETALDATKNFIQDSDVIFTNFKQNLTLHLLDFRSAWTQLAEIGQQASKDVIEKGPSKLWEAIKAVGEGTGEMFRDQFSLKDLNMFGRRTTPYKTPMAAFDTHAMTGGMRLTDKTSTFSGMLENIIDNLTRKTPGYTPMFEGPDSWRNRVGAKPDVFAAQASAIRAAQSQQMILGPMARPEEQWRNTARADVQRSQVWFTQKANQSMELASTLLKQIFDAIQAGNRMRQEQEPIGIVPLNE